MPRTRPSHTEAVTRAHDQGTPFGDLLRDWLHPDGLAPRIRNLAEWRHHVAGRLRREIAAGGPAQLLSLLDEIGSYPGGFATTRDLGGVAVPLELYTNVVGCSLF